MIPLLEPMLAEIHEETVITKRILDRVPGDKLSWKPHQKSMSLGQLALTLPAFLAAWRKSFGRKSLKAIRPISIRPRPRISKRFTPLSIRASGRRRNS